MFNPAYYLLYCQVFEFPFDTIKVRKSDHKGCQGAKQRTIRNTVITKSGYLAIKREHHLVIYTPTNANSAYQQFSPPFHISVVHKVQLDNEPPPPAMQSEGRDFPGALGIGQWDAGGA